MKEGPSTSIAKTDMRVSCDALAALVSEAAHAHPRECCGILLGEGSLITAISPARNVHPAPQTHFEIDPQSLIDAHRDARGGGRQVIGYYHSHPSGRAEPSATDRLMAAADGMVWAIVAGDRVSLWRDAQTGFTPLSYACRTA